MKQVLLNLTFKDKGKSILSNDIIWDVLDEVRKERKILMVLKDANVDDYIDLDMTEIDITTAQDDKELPLNIRLACEEKLKFREKLA